jgi:membrane fusion protein, multidrug efflux system
MIKRIIITVLGLLILVGAIAGVKGLQIQTMIASAKQAAPPPETVSAAKATADSWDNRLTAVGSLVAVQGVSVTAELSGKVIQIPFEAGAKVKAGDILLRQDASAEEAQLRSAEAAAELARTNLKRSSDLLASKTISQSEFDSANAQAKESAASADNLRAAIAKKTIRAPFAGRLGIRQVNLGQVVNEGTAIVTLQALDPIYADFQIPQQQLSQVSPGLVVELTSDALPGQAFAGKISVINPQVDTATRNVKIRAALDNPQERLLPGMFANVSISLPTRDKVLAIPTTAVLYAPYSDSVFVVEEKKGEDGKPAGLALRQQFVKLGERRGDYVAVTGGLKDGESVASTGVFKLRNGQAVVVDNTLSPKFSLTPEPKD